MGHVSVLGWTLLLVALSIGLYVFSNMIIFASQYFLPALVIFAVKAQSHSSSTNSFGISWYPPDQTETNDVEKVINGTGIYGFIFNNSYAPAGNDYYGGYNWCNMPHVNMETYQEAPAEYTLEYVEVIHRHHKRTPYASNTFPRESYTWDCSNEGLYSYGKPLGPTGNDSTSTYWSVYTSPSNPFTPQGFNGTCQFPQITRGGLDDSWQHGKDLYSVYHDTLKFLPNEPRDTVTYRVTNNMITSQVAGMIVNAMYPSIVDMPLRVQPATIDSLEPAYTCPTANTLYSTYGVSSTSPPWTSHLTKSAPLFASLDSLSDIPPDNEGWHQSWDHYYDNLSARLCDAKPLPCQNSNPLNCVNESIASTVFRLGQYEYSYIYRDAPQSLQASTASFGVWIAELADNIRSSISGESGVLYRHNVAHDGSLARLLSVLQVDSMVWPGLGAEIVFEIHRRDEERFVRILWGGVVFRSSNPMLGKVNMLPVDTLLEYLDNLAGERGRKLPALCNVS